MSLTVPKQRKPEPFPAKVLRLAKQRARSNGTLQIIETKPFAPCVIRRPNKAQRLLEAAGMHEVK